MAPVHAVRSALRGYIDVTGRARRSEFWWFLLATALLVAAGAVVDFFVVDSPLAGYGPLEITAQLATLLPTVAVAVRRLHDTGRSGWWFAGWLILSLAGEGLDLLDPSAVAGQVVVLVRDLAGFAATVLLTVFLVQRTRGPNRFGPPPVLDGQAQSSTPRT